MSVQLPPDDPLLRHLSGKRRFERIRKQIEVQLTGAGPGFAARTHDLSPGGARVEVVDPAFYAGEEREYDAWQAVSRRFGEGLRLDFVREQLQVWAQIVRILPEAEGRLALGCSFVRRLVPIERSALGLEGPAAEENGGARRELYVLLYDEGRRETAGPQIAARVSAVHGRTVLATQHIPPARARDIARGTSGRTLRAVLVRGQGAIWAGGARLVSLRPVSNDQVSLRIRTLQAALSLAAAR